MDNVFIDQAVSALSMIDELGIHQDDQTLAQFAIANALISIAKSLQIIAAAADYQAVSDSLKGFGPSLGR